MRPPSAVAVLTLSLPLTLSPGGPIMSQLQAGLAAADITPPVGVTMAGYSSRDKCAESVETPLSAHALVVASGEDCAALAFTDLIAVSPAIVSGVRDIVCEETGVSRDCVMVCGSHTHWGPEVRPSGYLPEHLKECVLPEYLDWFIREN